MSQHFWGAGAVLLLLAGCSGGAPLLSKSLPDETQVVDGPSLALPPSFELRPPREGADTKGYVARLNAEKTAEGQALIAGSAPVAGSASSSVPAGDVWLVNQAAQQGGVQADPNVRKDLDTTVAEEKKVEEKKSLWTKWFGKKDN